MKLLQKRSALAPCFALALTLPVLIGCQSTLVFFEQTAFKLGIGVNEEPTVPLEVTLGLKRRVVAVSPPKKPLQDGQPEGEAVSLISRFDVIYHPDDPNASGNGNGVQDAAQVTGNPLAGKLQIISAFASGEPAIEIARDPVATALVVEPEDVARALQLAPDTPPPTTPPPPTNLLGPISSTEKNLSFPDGKEVQASLCLGQIDGNFGSQGSNTRKAIKQYQRARNRTVTGVLTSVDAEELLGVKKCPNEAFKNVYERFRLGKKENYVALDETRVTRLQKRLQNKVTELQVNGQVTEAMTVDITGKMENGKMDDATRKAMKLIQRVLAEEETGHYTPAISDVTAL